MLPLNIIAVWQTTMKKNDYQPLVPVNLVGLDKVAESLLNSKEKEEPETSLPQVSAAINRASYLIVPQYSLLIAKYEPDEFKGFKWENKDNPKEGVHYKLRQKGLEMPTPLQFMTHFNNVVKAYKGNRILLDGNGRQLPRNEVEDLYKHFTTDHINGGAWTWLKARFAYDSTNVSPGSFNGINLETVVAVNTDGTLKTTAVPLQPCLWEDCFVTFDINAQGLSQTKSNKQQYSLEENIYFCRPRQNRVAMFGADAHKDFLGCGGDPVSSYAELGVFPCTVGATSQNGGSK